MSSPQVPQVAAASPLSERVCDAACVAFALWTAAANLTVAAGGSPVHLLGVAAVVFLAAGGVWLRWRRPARAIPLAPATSDDGDPLGVARALLAASALVGVALYARDRDVVLLWWFGVALLGTAAFLVLRRAPRTAEPPRDERGAETLVWVLAAVFALLTLVWNRTATDDAWYLNVAVAVADHPREPMLRDDTMYGAGFPLLNPVYRLHSYELANGALALLTGLPAIVCFHWVSASLAAVLVPLGYARLFRQLTPRIWPWAVVAVLVVLVFNGDVHRSYGSYAFVRIWQGKALFLTAILPLVYAYGLQYAARPSLSSWGLLCAVQVAAVGLTSSALWVAPLSAALALASAVPASLAGARRLATGMLASAYVIAGGLLVRSDTLEVSTPGPAPDLAPGVRLLESVELILGGGRFELLAAFAALAAWTACRPGPARRFAIGVPLGALLLVANPYAGEWIRGNITGPPQWRALWAVPVPVLIALLLCWPLELRGRPFRGVVLFACALVGFAVAIPRFSSFSSDTSPTRRVPVHTRAPALKVPALEYAWAERLNASVSPGAGLLAPRKVAPWIPTFSGHGYAVEVRPIYLEHYVRTGVVSEEEAARRDFLQRMVTDGVPLTGRGRGRVLARFREGLAAYDVQGICLEKNPTTPWLREALAEAGFRPGAEGALYEIWVLDPRVP